MTKTINKISKSIAYPADFYAGRFLLVAVFLLTAALYLYFTNLTVMNTISRNINLKKIEVIKKELRQTEEDYLRLSSNITQEYAYSLGFVEKNRPDFAKRTSIMAKATR
jgi:hypothetical protein